MRWRTFSAQFFFDRVESKNSVDAQMPVLATLGLDLGRHLSNG
jgi:hypothetical protein